MILPSAVAIAQICAALGVRRAVISPGSRNAPLTIALVRHPDIRTYTISDERSAAFIGLGMARQEQAPVALVCTSGSAAYNYAPAVAEAYFQQIPLLVLTADRPPEWIDQLDGQTIRQNGIYGRHVKASYELPVGQTESDQWSVERMVAEAINISQNPPYGPVHINIPIREPFYPELGELLDFTKTAKAIRTVPGNCVLSEESLRQLRSDWEQYPRRLVVAGQQPRQPELTAAVERFCREHQVPLVSDVISNQHSVSGAIKHADGFLTANSENDAVALRPDLLVTFGLSVISKNLKIFLRQYRPRAHWHIQPAGVAADTFQSLTRIIHCTPLSFFEQLGGGAASSEARSYYQSWASREEQARQQVQAFFDGKDLPAGEFQAVFQVLQNLPDAANLHLANSMAVRYANLLGLSEAQGSVEVWANRGTSGIDGSSSTSVGAAMVAEKLNVLITGDLAFFYDRNAFWHNYPLPNLRIVLLNNQGGGIFRMIDGPARQPELEEYFETKQPLTAENTARDFGMDYHSLDFTLEDDPEKLTALLPGFFREHSAQAGLLEIRTDSATNASILRRFKSFFQTKEE